MNRYIFKKFFGKYVLHILDYKYKHTPFGYSSGDRSEFYRRATEEEAQKFLEDIAKLQMVEKMYEHFSETNPEVLL